MKWLLAFHIMSVIAWFAGLFYLPRLFVYHSESTEPVVKQTFCVMEHKLFYYIMTPAAVTTLLSGLWLAVFYLPSHTKIFWLLAKGIFVLLLIGYHLSCGWHLHYFAHDKNYRNSRYFRLYNEIPTILMLVIVTLAVVKPF